MEIPFIINKTNILDFKILLFKTYNVYTKAKKKLGEIEIRRILWINNNNNNREDQMALPTSGIWSKICGALFKAPGWLKTSFTAFHSFRTTVYFLPRYNLSNNTCIVYVKLNKCICPMLGGENVSSLLPGPMNVCNSAEAKTLV